MKKILFIVTLFLIFGFVNSNTTCPTGWTSANFSYEIEPECLITVYYCTFTAPTGEYMVLIDKILVQVPCGLKFLDDGTFWNDMKDKVREHFVENGTFPPCPHSVSYVELKRAECWGITNVPATPQNPGGGHVELNHCGLIGYCEWYYKICYNQALGKPVITPNGYNSVSSELCSDTLPVLPPDGYTWDDDWTTECYGVTCIE